MSDLSQAEKVFRERREERWQHSVSLAGQKPLCFASYRPYIDGAQADVDFHALLARPVAARDLLRERS